MKKSILLLNPPSEIPVQRDFYCSHSVKAGYCWQPLDLLVISSHLKEDDINVIDCQKKHTSSEETIRLIDHLKPDIIISQTGQVCFSEDMKFLKRVYKIYSIPIFITGDTPYFFYRQILQRYSFIHGCITDIFHNNISAMIHEHESGLNIYTRDGGTHEPTPTDFSYGLPLITPFISPLYSLPYPGENIWTTTASQGCPFSCSYCHFEKIPYAVRNTEDIGKEIEAACKHGIRHIHFRDQTFGYDKRQLGRLIEILESTDCTFTIYTRADTLEKAEIKALYKAGLRNIETGVESTDFIIRKKYRKDIDDNKYAKFFDICRKKGIRTNSIFILGLADMEKEKKGILRFLRKYHPDYISLNCLIRKPGTSLMQGFHESPLDPSKTYDRKSAEVQADIYIRYYFHPRVILQFFREIKKISDLKDLVRNGYLLLKNILIR